MQLLNQKTKQYIFAAAGRKTSTTPKIRKTYPASAGMLSAAATPTNNDSSISNKKKTVNTVKVEEADKKTTKFNTICREISKYGSISLSTMTVLNHGVSTFHKFSAAINEDQELYQQYVDSSKNYLKPHFSLPSDWYHARITFGTPWYF